MKTKFLGVIALAALTATGVSQPVSAQFGIKLGDIIKDKIKLPSLADITAGKAPVSSKLDDAVYGDPSKDGWEPPQAARPMTSLARTGTGGFVLKPGYYQLDAQSYCLKGYTHGPDGGDGYLYAPVLGSAQDAVETILRESNNHPEIAQRKIQLLLWAIVARAKFEDLNNDLKVVAAQLLSKKQLASLNRNALSVLTSKEFQKVTGGAPAPLRAVLKAEADMRRLLTAPSLAYDQIEDIAVLTGEVPLGEGSRMTPRGRWSAHPDGYYIRYFPSSYSRTKVEIWVDPASNAVGDSYEPWEHIAMPGNTSRQRLGQSARLYGN